LRILTIIHPGILMIIHPPPGLHVFKFVKRFWSSKQCCSLFLR